MRHLKKGRKLNRTSAHRGALMRNLAISFIKYGSIKTTLPKAKEIRMFVEPLITLGKEDTVAKRRRAFALLGNKEAVGKLFDTTSKLSAKRPGGYLRILKAGIRTGDKAPMAFVRLVDAPEDYASINYEPPAPKRPRAKPKAATPKAAKDTKKASANVKAAEAAKK